MKLDKQFKDFELVISFKGDAGAGKDTAADYLVDKYGFKKDSFGKHLKDVVALAFFIQREMLDDQEFKSSVNEFTEMTVRTILQKVGTECFRNQIGDDFWIRCLLRRNKDYTGPLALTDSRMENEINEIQANGGHVVLIRRQAKMLQGQEAKHISEAVLDNVKYSAIFENNGTKEELYAQIDAFMKTLQPEDPQDDSMDIVPEEKQEISWD
jgi:hypothetical protein